MRDLIKRLMLVAGLVLFAWHSVVAQDRMWFGTWTLNRALSHFTGPSITITRIPTGYHFDFGAVNFDIGDDGKDYPTVPTRSTSLKRVGERTWFRVHKVDGKEVDQSTLRVTPDEKTLLIHTVGKGADGTTHISDDKEERVGDGTGLAGTWKSDVAGINVSEVIEIGDLGGGKMRWGFPGDGEFYVASPDGVPVAYEGPRSVPGVTVTLRRVSQREMRWTVSIKGKPYTEGVDDLSGDGKLLTETTWPVARPMDKQEAVYARK